jgi:hypothetical protein
LRSGAAVRAKIDQAPREGQMFVGLFRAVLAFIGAHGAPKWPQRALIGLHGAPRRPQRAFIGVHGALRRSQPASLGLPGALRGGHPGLIGRSGAHLTVIDLYGAHPTIIGLGGDSAGAQQETNHKQATHGTSDSTNARCNMN